MVPTQAVGMAWSAYGRAGITAFLVSVLLTPVVRRIALRLKMVQQPRSDRHNRRVVPVLGGIAIFSGFLVAVSPSVGSDARIPPLVIGATLMFALGLVDDFHPLAPAGKLIGQIVAAGIPALGALGVSASWHDLFHSIPSVLWIVAMVNAFNLIDNMDGLAAGTAAICAAFISGLAVQSSSPVMLLSAVCVGGASLGFLVYNFHPARIFMGDSGSLVMGYVLSVAIASQRLRGEARGVRTWLEPVLLLGLPVLDTCFVVVTRLSRGKKIWQGGRDHLSHRLVAVGLTERSAVILLYVISAALSSCALWVLGSSEALSLAVGCTLLGLLGSAGFWLARLSRVRVGLPKTAGRS